MPRRVVFLESLHGVESLFTRGLRSGAAANGWAVEVLFLRRPDGAMEDQQTLQRKLRAARPDLICFLMDAPIAWETLWQEGSLRTIPKCSFWFDDFFRSPLTMQHVETWRCWQKEENVSVFFHDGYWREKWERHAGHAAQPIHLGVDEMLFPPAPERAPALFPELEGHAVMLGTIPARASLEEDLKAFPVVVRKWIEQTVAALEKAPWPFRPYELSETIAQGLSPKEQVILNHWRNEVEPHGQNRALANHQLWRWGKRIARLRGLRALARRVPVAVLSGHGQEVFAKEAELRIAIAPTHSFIFHDTTGIPASKWSLLFRSGSLQVQWTDPQSIESGAPFRMFEAAAAAVPLLSDARPGFPALFTPEKEMLFAEDEMALAERAEKFLAESREALQQIGQHARAACLARHTWAIRWREILRARGI